MACNLAVASVDSDIQILEINKPYPIIHVTSLERDAESTFIVLIHIEINNIVKIYLTEICDRETEVNLTTMIIVSENYRLIYNGRYECLSQRFHLEPV